MVSLEKVQRNSKIVIGEHDPFKMEPTEWGGMFFILELTRPWSVQGDMRLLAKGGLNPQL